jgi:excisionase family DNA binding protein
LESPRDSPSFLASDTSGIVTGWDSCFSTDGGNQLANIQITGGTYFTLDEVARKLGIRYLTLWRRIHKTNTPHIRIGRSILVRIEDLQQTSDV